MSKQDVIEVTGVIEEALANSLFRVRLDKMDTIILCHLSGKIRQNFIRFITGDKVKVEMSPYDMTKGRITYRLK